MISASGLSATADSSGRTLAPVELEAWNCLPFQGRLPFRARNHCDWQRRRILTVGFAGHEDSFRGPTSGRHELEEQLQSA